MLVTLETTNKRLRAKEIPAAIDPGINPIAIYLNFFLIKMHKEPTLVLIRSHPVIYRSITLSLIGTHYNKVVPKLTCLAICKYTRIVPLEGST